MSARLRRARVADAAAVAQVHAESWQVAYAGVLPRSYLATLRPEPLARYWARRLRRGELGCSYDVDVIQTTLGVMA